MRLRIPELMENGGLPTAYAIAKASEGRISMTNAHYLVEKRGATERVDMDTLRGLCRAFKVGPDKLLTEDPLPPEPVVKPKRKRKPAAKSKR